MKVKMRHNKTTQHIWLIINVTLLWYALLITQHINLVLLNINFVCNNGERILHNMIQLRVLYIYYLGYLGWILIWCIGKYFGEYIDDRGSFRITVIKFVFNIHFLLETKLCITRISGPDGPLLLAVDLWNTPKGCPIGPLF